MEYAARARNYAGNTVVIANIDLMNSDRIRDFLEIIQISGRQIVDNVNSATLGKQASDQGGTYKAGSSRDDISIHNFETEG